MLLLGAALAPTCLTGGLIYKYAVDVPYADEWQIGRFFERLIYGTLTFRHLFAQANEYRQFFPNLLFLGLGHLTKWDMRYEMLCSFLLACLISFNIYRLGRLTLARFSQTQRRWLYVGANLLIFSPAQYDNWLQGQQVVFFVPVACLTTCLLIACSARLRPGAKFSLCALLATISTFSAANGLLCWLLPLPILAWPVNRAELRRKRWWLLAWALGLALNVALYFYDYHKPPASPAPSAALTHPVRAGIYFLSVLGLPLGFSRLLIAVSVGALAFALYAWAARQFGRTWRAAVDARALLVWLLLGAYSILTAALIAFGRVGFGLDQSLSSRYTTYTLYLPVALVYLLPLTLGRAAAAHERAPVDQLTTRARLVPLLVAALLVLHVPIYLLGVRQMSEQRVTMLQLKACLQLVNVVWDDCSPRVYGDADILRRIANLLERQGYIRPGLAHSDRLQDFAATDAQAPDNYGAFLSLTQTSADQYVATGRAVLPHRGEPADAVLLAYDGEDGAAHVFAIADMALERDFVSALLRRGVQGDARWHKFFSGRSLPPHARRLSAWAFDVDTGRAYRLAGTQTIAPPTASASSQTPH